MNLAALILKDFSKKADSARQNSVSNIDPFDIKAESLCLMSIFFVDRRRQSRVALYLFVIVAKLATETT
jgi:hypothetical protein